MKKIIHKADSRGYLDHGWLKTHHTFSFNTYYEPERIRFGLLRVLNDDTIEPGMGFGTHPHDNMEIVTIPLSGSLEHQDSTGHSEVLNTNEVQIMSAGSGLTHSEFNHSDTEKLSLLQIWVFPKQRDITPRYDQRAFNPEMRRNTILTVVSPEKNDSSMWINQDAYFSLSSLDAGKKLDYKIKHKNNGLYVFVIDGVIETAGETLDKRDAIGLTEIDNIDIKAKVNADLLFIDVPMNLTNS